MSLWQWISAIAENRSLRLKVAELECKLERGRQQLFEEIDANREREDALVERITGIPKQAGEARNLLSKPPPLPDDDDANSSEETIVPELVFGEFSREMIEMRARDFQLEAARNGTHYDFDKLCTAIAANPHEFLSN